MMPLLWFLPGVLAPPAAFAAIRRGEADQFSLKSRSLCGSTSLACPHCSSADLRIAASEELRVAAAAPVAITAAIAT
jgi:hypothetical protein